MTTRATLRTTIRTELNDSGASPLWTDALLNELINQAIRSYSRELPKQSSSTITVVANQEAYNLPADFDRAVRVEQPDDTIRVFDPLDRGTSDEHSSSESSGATSRGAWGYRIWASKIVLNPIPTSIGSTQNITLDYLARYAEPTADGDTIATPASDDDILQASSAPTPCAGSAPTRPSANASSSSAERLPPPPPRPSKPAPRAPSLSANAASEPPDSRSSE